VKSYAMADIKEHPIYAKDLKIELLIKEKVITTIIRSHNQNSKLKLKSK